MFFNIELSVTFNGVMCNHCGWSLCRVMFVNLWWRRREDDDDDDDCMCAWTERRRRRKTARTCGDVWSLCSWTTSSWITSSCQYRRSPHNLPARSVGRSLSRLCWSRCWAELVFAIGWMAHLLIWHCKQSAVWFMQWYRRRFATSNHKSVWWLYRLYTLTCSSGRVSV